MKTLDVICVHGIGSGTPPTFADKAMRRLGSALLKQGVNLNSRSVTWGSLMDADQKRMLKSVKDAGAVGGMVQRLSSLTLADALSVGQYQDQINYLVDYHSKGMKAPVLIGHSLGCLVLSNWLAGRPHREVSHLVTTGCNLELFFQREGSYQTPHQVAYTGKWTNVYAPRDGLGFPLRNWLFHVEDVRLRVGTWLTRWNGLSHTGFWASDELFSDVLPPRLIGYAR